MQTSQNAGTDNAGGDDLRAATTAKAASATAALNQDLLAGLAKLREGDEEAKPDEPEAKPDPKPDPAAPPAEAKHDAKPLDEVPLDDKAKARLAAEQARDRKHKEAVAKDRGELEAAKAKLEAEWAPRVAKAEAFEALKGGGAAAAMRALEQLELSEADYEALAPATWALSAKGKADPKAKAAAAGTLQAHGMEARFAKLEADNKALRDQIAQRETAQKHAADRDQYITGVEKALDTAADAPLVKKLATAAPARARALFLKVAVDLLDEHEVVPSHAEVLAEAERRERADLAERGLDVASLIAPAKAAAAAPKTPPKTLANEGGTGAAVVPTPAKSGKALDAEIIAGLRNLRKSGSVT